VGLRPIEGPESLTPTSRASFARLGPPLGGRELTADVKTSLLRITAE
jgi:hypothetical protein